MAAAALAPDAWQAALPRKGRSAARRRGRRQAAAGHPEAKGEPDLTSVLCRLREAREDLLLSDFWSSARETVNSCLSRLQQQVKAPEGPLSEALGHLHLHSSADEADVAQLGSPGQSLLRRAPPLQCVCYGLGNFATCAIARSQLTFLLLFLEECQIPRSCCCVYDPLFSQLETAVLDALGVTVLQENEEGKRAVGTEPTVFYMPHCGTALYNNLLWRNWSVGALARMVIVGNSFRGLQERLLTRILQRNYPYIAKVISGLEELALPETSRYMDVFNDTAIHWFPAHRLSQLSADTWAFRDEPDYEDCEGLEIIRHEAKGSCGGQCDQEDGPVGWTGRL
ncbi:SRR1-like protein [Tenrec ecaudatus]|uniref:SRR1-like protein n=1 Tax=Tenrec ecaudatus TaxID=94439 RepID=UPI003F5AD7E7